MVINSNSVTQSLSVNHIMHYHIYIYKNIEKSWVSNPIAISLEHPYSQQTKGSLMTYKLFSVIGWKCWVKLNLYLKEVWLRFVVWWFQLQSYIL